MADIPGEGFELGAAFVSVSPEAPDFQGEVEAIVAGTDVVVNVPVVPDAAGFRARLEEEVAGSDAAVTVPVVPDTAGFKLLIDEAATAGEESGAAYSERFTAAASAKPPVAGMLAGSEAEAAVAGETAGLSFGERFGAEGAVAGEGFMGKLKDAISGGLSPMELLLGGAFVAATAIMASSFQSAMEKIHTQAGVAQSSIAGLSNQVLDLAGKVGEAPGSLAASLYHVESAFQSNGITASAALHDVQIAAEGARVGGADLVDTTNALTALMKSGLVGGANSAAQAMGALNAIVGSGDMTMQNFTEALGSGLVAQAPLYHQSITQVGAALAVLGDSNIRGAKAATDLRMAWQAIQSPMKTGDAALQHLGLTVSSLADTMTHHGLSAAIDEFVAHLKTSHVPVGEWGKYVTEIFGKRAGAGIGVLTEQFGNLNLKLGTVAHGVHNFGNAWADTQKTTSQKLHEMEAGFQALMIKIGQGLLPVLGDVFAAVAKALPGIEKTGSGFAKIASPAVKTFFHGLAVVLKELLGPLRSVTEAVGVGILAFMGISKVIEIIKAIRLAWLALQATLLANPFVALAAAVIAIAFLIFKYHKQIWDVITKTWHDITSFFAGLFGPIVRPVEKIFDAIKSFITGSFDGWWKSHGQELVTVWNAVWGSITKTFTAAWGDITGTVTSAWQLVGPFLTAALAVLKGYFKVTWAAISLIVKVAWDTITAIVKVAIAYITATIKVAWDVIVGIFNVALDLITGHWSKAWNDAKAMVTQVFNAIKAFFGSFWSAVSSLFTQDVNSITSFLSAAWNAIRSAVVTAFDNIRHDIASVWDGIVADAENFIGMILSKIAGLGSAIGSIPGKVLNAINPFSGASGGIVPGTGTGDHVPALLTPKETVVSVAHSKLLAPAFAAVGVPGYGGGGIVSDYGPVRRYAGGGAVGWGGSNDVGSLLMALVQALSGGQGWGGGRGMAGGGNAISMVFNGTQMPTPEQQQAMKLMLTSAVSNA